MRNNPLQWVNYFFNLGTQSSGFGFKTVWHRRSALTFSFEQRSAGESDASFKWLQSRFFNTKQLLFFIDFLLNSDSCCVLLVAAVPGCILPPFLPAQVIVVAELL